jgi:hypothetical protein
MILVEAFSEVHLLCLGVNVFVDTIGVVLKGTAVVDFTKIRYRYIDDENYSTTAVLLRYYY